MRFTMENKNLTIGAHASEWPDYELLDSGDNKKLERFGSMTLIRPETQAIWRPIHPQLWKQADAEFLWNDGKGSWRGKNLPDMWDVAWNKEALFTLRLTSFKHTGVFPEQAPNWEWIRDRVETLKKSKTGSDEVQPPKVLNLFGYTGLASIVAAKHGAHVTHLDASKQSNTWAKENSMLSEVPDGYLRYITDDALKFVEREIRRGSMYNGIILDPPAFGRGANGEVWRIEEHIVILMDALKKIFSEKPGSFFLLNGYAAGYAPQSLLQSAESAFPEIADAAGKKTAGEFGELRIQESKSTRCIPSGIYVRFIR
jgi:23S rRNA (cytosine1962-C5)-methyltransferase